MSALSCEGVADASEAIDMLPIEDSDTELAPVTGRPPGPAALREVVCITAAKPSGGGRPDRASTRCNSLVPESFSETGDFYNGHTHVVRAGTLLGSASERGILVLVGKELQALQCTRTAKIDRGRTD